MKLLKLTALFASTCFTSIALADVPTASQPAASTTPDTYTSQSIDPAKKAEILKVIKLTGVEDKAKQMLPHTFAMLQGRPGLSQEFLQKLFEKMQAEMPNFIDRFVPIYDRYYTMNDLKAMDAFYSSPEGQKILSIQTIVGQETMIAGRLWGQQLAAEVMAEMKKEKTAQEAAKPAAK